MDHEFAGRRAGGDVGSEAGCSIAGLRERTGDWWTGEALTCAESLEPHAVLRCLISLRGGLEMDAFFHDIGGERNFRLRKDAGEALFVGACQFGKECPERGADGLMRFVNVHCLLYEGEHSFFNYRHGAFRGVQVGLQ